MTTLLSTVEDPPDCCNPSSLLQLTVASTDSSGVASALVCDVPFTVLCEVADAAAAALSDWLVSASLFDVKTDAD